MARDLINQLHMAVRSYSGIEEVPEIDDFDEHIIETVGGVYEQLNEAIETSLSEHCTKVMKTVMNKIHENHNFWLTMTTKSMSGKCRIPLLALLSDMNGAQHQTLIHRLANAPQYHDISSESIVVRISSANASSGSSRLGQRVTLKKMLQTVVTGIVPDKFLAQLNWPKSCKFSFTAVKLYFSSKEFLRTHKRPCPVLVVLENPEEIPPYVLNGFLCEASQYLSHVPLQIILLLPFVREFRKKLTFENLKKTTLQTFQVNLSTAQRQEVFIKHLFLNPQTLFRLGPNMFKYLMDRMHYYDSSLEFSLRAYCLSMLWHLEQEPLSQNFLTLTTAAKRDELQKAWSKLNKKQWQDLLQKFHVDGDLKKSTVCELMNTVREWAEKVQVVPLVLKWMVHLMTTMDDNLRRTLFSDMNLYRMCLLGVKDTQTFKKFLSHIDLAPIPKLLSLLETATEAIVKETEALFPNESLAFVVQMSEDVKQLIERQDEILEAASKNRVRRMKLKPSTSSMRVDGARLEIGGKNKMKDLQKTLEAWRLDSPRSASSSRATVRQQGHVGRDVVSDGEENDDWQQFKNGLREILPNLLAFPTQPPIAMRLFVFDDVERLRRNLDAVIRQEVHNTLTNPHWAMQHDSLKLDLVDSIHSHLPDVSVLYKLIQEGGHYVNLYDVLIACSVYYDTMSDAPPSQEVQARFFQALWDLNFMTCVKKTSSKADQMARLIFGAL